MRFNLPNFNDCDCLCQDTGTGTLGTGDPPSSGCCDCTDCPFCWWIKFVGVTTAPPNPFLCVCENLNKQLWNVTWDDLCYWRGVFVDVPGGEDTIQCCGPISASSLAFTLSYTSKVDGVSVCRWTVTISIGCPGASRTKAIYEIEDCNYDCEGPLTLNLIKDGGGDPTKKCNWPATIEIIPNRTCLGTDTGTGTPGPPGPPSDCEDNFCVWEWVTFWQRIFFGCPNFTGGGPTLGCDCVEDPPITGNEKLGDQFFRACNTFTPGTAP